MRSKIDSIHQNGTWNLMLIPLGKKIIIAKWVFKLKVRIDGRSHKHKSMLVAQGYKGENIFGWYHYKSLQGMKKEQKRTKSFSWAFYFKCVHNYKLFFPHVYQCHALIYGLKFILDFFVKLSKKLIFN
jgi:hypothetical protein